MTTVFYWSFSDVFIMIISIGITHRFQQINKRIDYLKGRVVSNDRWNDIRIDYVEVCELLKFVDNSLGKIILLATLNNSYLILVQVLSILA
jgi:gustatory receptor